MRITFELEPADIARFHEALARAERRVACADECDIVAAARHALETLPIANAPGYIRRRLRDSSIQRGQHVLCQRIGLVGAIQSHDGDVIGQCDVQGFQRGRRRCGAGWGRRHDARPRRRGQWRA